MTVPNCTKDEEVRGSGLRVRRGEGIVGAIVFTDVKIQGK